MVNGIKGFFESMNKPTPKKPSTLVNGYYCIFTQHLYLIPVMLWKQAAYLSQKIDLFKYWIQYRARHS